MQCCSCSRTHKFQKRSTKKFTIWRIRLDVKYIKFDYCNCKVNVSKIFNIDIHNIQKPKLIKSQWQSFLKTWLFLGHFLYALGIIAFNMKKIYVCFFVYMSISMEKWYMYIPSWDTFDQIMEKDDWQGLLKIYNIIT